MVRDSMLLFHLSLQNNDPNSLSLLMAFSKETGKDSLGKLCKSTFKQHFEEHFVVHLLAVSHPLMAKTAGSSSVHMFCLFIRRVVC